MRPSANGEQGGRKQSEDDLVDKMPTGSGVKSVCVTGVPRPGRPGPGDVRRRWGFVFIRNGFKDSHNIALSRKEVNRM